MRGENNWESTWLIHIQLTTSFVGGNVDHFKRKFLAFHGEMFPSLYLISRSLFIM